MINNVTDDMELKEQIRKFLIYQVGVAYSNIDKIKIERMRDGQLRNIDISFIPNLYQED